MVQQFHSPVTVAQLIEETAARFEAAADEGRIYFGHGTDNPLDEAAWLVLQQLSLPFDPDEAVFAETVPASKLQQIRSLTQRRIEERQPLAYLLQQAWFCGLAFYVDQRVLVPRSPLSELIQQQFRPWLAQPPAKVLDLCTGSGCIGIATATVFADAEVVLSDLSADAIAVARRNIAEHKLDTRVTVVQSDLFDNLEGERFNLIVSNPPYVDESDLAAMPAEYRHEPELGLASGSDGLDFTRQLLACAADYLTAEGVLVVEVGNSWQALQASYPQLPFTWLDFEHGGHGVFVLTREQLVASNSANSL